MLESKLVEKAIERFTESFSSLPMTDAQIAIRVIGEFSAGKTRFINELLRDRIPEKLQPVSSLEVQTILPLEVTWGDAPSLHLVRREGDDVDGVMIRSFDSFPDRNVLEGSCDPSLMRLRLSVPEPRLTLAHGDGVSAEDAPKRLFLIDMPGWNSVDDERGCSEPEFSSDWQNLAMVYVSQATRLDSQLNRERLHNFVQAFLNYDLTMARNRCPLLFIVTRCPKDERERRAHQQMERLRELIGEEDIDRLPCKVICIDFEEMSPEDCSRFQQDVWNFILSESPSEPVRKHYLEDSVRRWPKEWDLRAYLEACIAVMDRAVASMKDTKQNGKFLGGRTSRSLRGFSTQKEIEETAHKWWERQTGTSLEEILKINIPEMPAEHPLREWIDAYWIPRVKNGINKVQKFYWKMDEALTSISVTSEDIEKDLAAHVGDAWEDALKCYDDSFIKLCETIKEIDSALPAFPTIVAVLYLSYLEARYQDGRKSLVFSRR